MYRNIHSFAVATIDFHSLLPVWRDNIDIETIIPNHCVPLILSYATTTTSETRDSPYNDNILFD